MSDHVYTKFTRSTNKEALLAVIDVLILTFVISVLVGFFWGGTWLLLDIYLLPDNNELSSWISFLIGNFTFIPATLFQDDLQVFVLSFKKNRFLKYFLFSRLYSYILAIAAVNQWRGSAYLLMLYTGVSLQADLACLVVGVISLCLLQTYRSVVIPPLGTATDVYEEYHFFIQTRFCKPARSMRYVLDTLFTILIINTLVVFFWKGAWLLLEVHILPRDEVSAVVICSLTFFGLYSIPLVGQYEVRRFMKSLDKKSKILKYIVKYSFIIFCSVLPVIFWKGVFTAQNYLVYNHYLIIGSWLSHIIAYVSLVLLMATNSLVPRGCYLDGVNEFDVMFEVKYIIPIKDYFRKLRR